YSPTPVAFAPPFLSGLPTQANGTPITTVAWPPNGTGIPQATYSCFAHEGRMPPLVGDFRFDAQFSGLNNNPNFPNYTGNLGANRAGVVRLRRVWDTWSTDYTSAPATGFDPSTGLPLGPPFTPPVYPSFPPPYPAPLRGIQIQIRVVDPRNE